MIEIDGSLYSGSGTIVRQSVALSALTGKPVHIIKARVKRDKPGLRAQHVQVVRAISELVHAKVDGATVGSLELTFQPGGLRAERQYVWDIGSAGSTTMLALAVLPVLAFCRREVRVEFRGGLFQDFAPSVFHLQHVVLPLLQQMGLKAEAMIERPGYVPTGQGILRLTVTPLGNTLERLCLDEQGPVQRVWGTALASHLEKRKVSKRMADSARQALKAAGYQADIEERDDTSSLQPGAALSLCADCGDGVRLGADQAGALRRSAESIGKFVARQLLADLETGATLDRYAADQIIPFAALADGESRFRIPCETDHVQTNAWLAGLFLGARVRVKERVLTIVGAGHRPPATNLDRVS